MSELSVERRAANSGRADRAAAVLSHYQTLSSSDDEDAICDLLADLMHFVSRVGGGVLLVPTICIRKDEQP
jgi:hypothetical protein